MNLEKYTRRDIGKATIAGGIASVTPKISFAEGEIPSAESEAAMARAWEAYKNGEGIRIYTVDELHEHIQEQEMQRLVNQNMAEAWRAYEAGGCEEISEDELSELMNPHISRRLSFGQILNTGLELIDTAMNPEPVESQKIMPLELSTQYALPDASEPLALE